MALTYATCILDIANTSKTLVNALCLFSFLYQLTNHKGPTEDVRFLKTI